MKYNIIAIILILGFIGLASSEYDSPYYRSPLLSGVIFAEEAAQGTTTGQRFSFGNGDNATSVTVAYDMWITHLTISTQASCTGTAEVRIDTNNVGAVSTVTGISGFVSSPTLFDPPLKVRAGTRLTFNRTTGCSGGGNGMVVSAWWVAKPENYPQVQSLD